MDSTGDSWICAITKHHNKVKPWKARRKVRAASSDGSGSPDGAAAATHFNGEVASTDAVSADGGDGALGNDALEDSGVRRQREAASMAQSSRDTSASDQHEEDKEYVCILSQLSIGDRIKTPRGFVSKSHLSPELLDEHSDLSHLLPTDKGSRIGIIYLPQVS